MPETPDGSPTDDARPTPWERRPPPWVRPHPGDHHGDEQHQQQSRHQRLTRLAGKVGVATVAVLVFLTTAVGWAATLWFDGRFREVSALDPDSAAVTDAPAQYGDENFLLVGSDSRAGAQPADDVGTVEQVGGARADTIMIAHLPSDRSRAVIVSFPRDLQVPRPPCEVWDPVSGAYTGEFDPGESSSKINSAYQVGGPRCMTRVVQKLSGLVVNHFLGIDFQGFKGLVDAVGGVEVCLEQPLEDLELGMILPRPGVSTISGTTALDFVRARSVVGDPTGDYGRIVRQQRFLSSLLRELLSANVLFSAKKLRAVTDAVAANTVGENVEVATLLRLAQSLPGLDPAEVTFVTVPTVGEPNEYGNEELREQDTQALFQAIIAGLPLPGEVSPTSRPPGSRPTTATPKAPPPAPTGIAVPQPLLAPADVRLRVLNGSGVAGQAGSAARALQALGFGVVEIGNASELVDLTVIRYPPDRRAEARTLAAALPQAVLQVDYSQIGVVVLVIGPEFDGSVTQLPTPPGAPPPLPVDLTTVNGADTACG